MAEETVDQQNAAADEPYQRICLIHYHEIGLKGHNRASFENRLLKNAEYALHEQPIVTIRRISGRLLVFIKEGTSYERATDIARIIATLPGVARVSCGYTCERDLDVMNDAAVRALREFGPFETFKVSARRNHTDFDVDSMSMQKLIGAYLCRHFPDKKVKMKGQDATVHVEVIQSASYVYAFTMPGIGGLPVGSSGKVMGLLSSGIDSPVALWRMARRGAVCMAVHFSGRPQTSATSEYLVDDIAHVLERSGCIARVFVVPFGDYQRQIAATVPPELRIIMYRRLMFRVAEQLAKQNHCKAIVTGESLGQVASQTIENITVTNAVIEDLPVFRPLIGTDKQEIISQAEELGTFEISSTDAPDCCTLFMPRSPETHAKLSRVEEVEQALPIEAWVPKIVASAEVHDYRCPAFRPHKDKDPHAQV